MTPSLPRAARNGVLLIASIAIAVRLYHATTRGQRRELVKVHAGCGLKLGQELRCSKHGLVQNTDTSLAFETPKGELVALGKDEADALKPTEPEAEIEVVGFAPAADIDPSLRDSPMIVAAGPGGHEALGVVAVALAKEKAVGLGRVVLYGRKRDVLIESLGGWGLRLTTLHPSRQLVSLDVFHSGPSPKTPGTLVTAMRDLIQAMPVEFAADQVPDHAGDRLEEIVAAVLDKRPIAKPKAPAGRPTVALSLADALAESVSTRRAKAKR